MVLALSNSNGTIQICTEQVRYDVVLQNASVFYYGDSRWECIYYQKEDRWNIEKVNPTDEQRPIRFVNVRPKPPLKPGDVLLYGEDNWFCCYGSSRIVSMLKYDAIYTEKVKKSKGFQFLIGP